MVIYKDVPYSIVIPFGHKLIDIKKTFATEIEPLRDIMFHKDTQIGYSIRSNP